MQPYSCTLCETGEDVTANKPETEDNRRLLLLLFDNLNKLRENLNRLNYLLERKKIELILYQK